jgi:hypothetical protein
VQTGDLLNLHCFAAYTCVNAALALSDGTKRGGPSKRHRSMVTEGIAVAITVTTGRLVSRRATCWKGMPASEPRDFRRDVEMSGTTAPSLHRGLEWLDR